MDYTALRSELLTDPVALGYSGLTDTQATAKLNAVDTGRTLARTAVPPAELFNAINDAAWPATAILQDKLRALLGMPTIDASNVNTRGIVAAIFPASGATLATNTRLVALGTQTVSRAVELSLGPVTTVDVTRARSGVW